MCKLGPGTGSLIRIFSEIRILSVAQLNQAFLAVGCMLTSTYDFQAKFQLPTGSRSTLILVLKNRNALTDRRTTLAKKHNKKTVIMTPLEPPTYGRPTPSLSVH